MSHMPWGGPWGEGWAGEGVPPVGEGRSIIPFTDHADGIITPRNLTPLIKKEFITRPIPEWSV